MRQFTTRDKEIYKKRIKVENSFCLLKKNKRLQLIYDSHFSTYVSLVFLGFGLMISKLC